MKAIFCAPFANGSPVLPPMQAFDGGLQLGYTENSILCGGFSCVGHVPQAPTCLVWVWADEATITAMSLDTDHYIFIDEVIDAQAP